MNDDAFADRLARVRRRFVSTLEGRIDDIAAGLPKLGREAPAAPCALDPVERRGLA